MEPLTKTERRTATDDFLERYEDAKGLLPSLGPLPYDPVPDIDSVAWSIPIIDEMVAGEIRELTNQLNQWMGALRRWYAWNDVLAGRDEQIRWAIEWEFVEPLAFQCMFQPSATRDRFTFVATNALHQVHLAITPGHKDVLLGDPTHPADIKHYPNRRTREKQS